MLTIFLISMWIFEENDILLHRQIGFKLKVTVAKGMSFYTPALVTAYYCAWNRYNHGLFTMSHILATNSET